MTESGKIRGKLHEVAAAARAVGPLALAACAASVLAIASAAPAGAATCSSLTAPQDFSTFENCTGRGNDFFADISAEVDRLFGIQLTDDLSYSPGPGSNAEFNEARANDNEVGLAFDPAADFDGNTFTFTSLPQLTLFVSFKQGPEWDLWRVPQAFLDGTQSSFEITHTLGNDTSHISTFGVIPLPAAGWLLLGGLGALGALGHRRRRAAA